MTKSRLSALLCTAVLGLAALPAGAAAATKPPPLPANVAAALAALSPAQLQQLLAYAATLTTPQLVSALKSLGLTNAQVQAVLIYLHR